jgi:tetraacyldisaccharide 4'-kinase
MKVFRYALYPFALIYGLIIFIRHKLFDKGILPSKEYDIPVIGVGNLTVGGTGKTPMIEYLIRLLNDSYKTATLSRGYGRKTKGFLLADQYSSGKDIGDEPMQFYKKFGQHITVAVDENRREGIDNLIQNDNKLDVVLLDDSFQHRYVKPGLNILLTDFYNLYPADHLLPVGRLRDLKSQAKRADIIVITKTDIVMSPILRRGIEKMIKPLPHQKIFFSFIDYGDYKPAPGLELPEVKKRPSVIVLFTGIANPWPLQDYLISRCNELETIEFMDHHRFKNSDIDNILKTFDNHFTRNKIIVTTEKDIMRLVKTPYFSRFKDKPLYYIPVEMKIHKPDTALFNQQILDYVKRNKRNR